jgi:protein TonB
MTTAGFYQPTRLSPPAIAVVVLLHGAALTALMMARMEMPGKRTFPPTQIDWIWPKPPPPPHQIKQLPKERPHDFPTTTDPRVRAIDLPPHVTVTKGDPEPPAASGTGDTGTIPPPPPPPPPPQRTFEPARARADLGSYVSDGDYPASAIRNEEQGTTRFLLQVGADGKVTGCTVTRSSGSAALDSTACRLMRSRARFTPARDGNGSPTADSVANAIHWVLPAG